MTDCVRRVAPFIGTTLSWYSGNQYERAIFIDRATGDMWWAYWTMVSCNVIAPQLFWFKKIRRSVPIMFVISIVINIGMWFERFVIIVTSLHHDFLPSAWGTFSPTLFDILTFAGSLGLFFTAFLLLLRWIPMIAIAEVKMVTPAADPHHEGGHAMSERGGRGSLEPHVAEPALFGTSEE